MYTHPENMIDLKRHKFFLELVCLSTQVSHILVLGFPQTPNLLNEAKAQELQTYLDLTIESQST